MRKALKRFVGVTLLVGALVASIGGSAFAGNGPKTTHPGQGSGASNNNSTNTHACADPNWCS